MAYEAKILADSVAPCGKRLTTMSITYPRFVHSEFMTHRMFSRNAASSRAIPVAKMIREIEDDPVWPVWWGKNQSGMQAAEELDPKAQAEALDWWLNARDNAVADAASLMHLGLHKQIANRLLEPWMWITVIVSATEWENFFHLRCHPDAQPEVRKIAEMMRDLYRANTPRSVTPDDAIPWHLPLISQEDLEYWATGELQTGDLVKIAVGRAARVSYLTREGKRDPGADIALHDRLLESGHWSPFEHVACPMRTAEPSGNYIGWKQYRKAFPEENYQGDA